MRAVRTRRWKYIRRYYSGHGPHRANCDAGPSKDLMLRLGWAEKIAAPEELYDLAYDPNETCNLAGSEETLPGAPGIAMTANPQAAGKIVAAPRGNAEQRNLSVDRRRQNAMHRAITAKDERGIAAGRQIVAED